MSPDARRKRAGERPVMSADELRAYIQDRKDLMRWTVALMLAGVGVLCVGTFTLNLWIMAVGFALFVAGVVWRSLLTSSLKKAIGASLVPSALREVFEDVVYRPGGHVSDAVIRGNDMGFHFHIDEIEGSDYVRATYRGIRFETSDIRLIHITQTTDLNGNVRTVRSTAFQGTWLTCAFEKKPLSCDLRLCERGSVGKRLALGGLKTENEAFNRRFHIQCESEHEMFYLLTPHMMEYILAMDEKGGGETHMRFTSKGQVHIAIRSKRDAFEVRRGEYDVDVLREKFLGEIRYLTDLMDELRLNPLYGTEGQGEETDGA